MTTTIKKDIRMISQSNYEMNFLKSEKSISQVAKAMWRLVMWQNFLLSFPFGETYLLP